MRIQPRNVKTPRDCKEICDCPIEGFAIFSHSQIENRTSENPQIFTGSCYTQAPMKPEDFVHLHPTSLLALLQAPSGKLPLSS